MPNLNQALLTVLVIGAIIFVINYIDHLFKKRRLKNQRDILNYLKLTTPDKILELKYKTQSSTGRGVRTVAAIYTLEFNGKEYKIYMSESFLWPDKSLPPSIPLVMKLTVKELHDYVAPETENGLATLIWI